jgi:hypothetical protein
MQNYLRLIIILSAISVIGLIVVWLFMRDMRGGPGVVESKISSQTVVQEVQKIGRLELVHYRIRDVFDKELSKPIGFGFSGLTYRNSNKLVLVISGEVIGCIDLAKLDSSAVQLADTVLTLRLPPAEVCVHKIDHQNTKVFSSDFSLLTTFQGKQAEIVDQAYKEAETQILEAAKKDGILQETDKQARVFLEPLVKKFGIKKVVFVK